MTTDPKKEQACEVCGRDTCYERRCWTGMGARGDCVKCHGPDDDRGECYRLGYERLLKERQPAAGPSAAPTGQLQEAGADELARVRHERDEACRLLGVELDKARRRWREDGWPICPTCGEDELYSLATPATATAIDGCYRCGSHFDPPKDFSRASSEKPPVCAPCACGKMRIPNPTPGIMDFQSVVHRHDACVFVGNPAAAPPSAPQEGLCGNWYAHPDVKFRKHICGLLVGHHLHSDGERVWTDDEITSGEPPARPPSPAVDAAPAAPVVTALTEKQLNEEK